MSSLVASLSLGLRPFLLSGPRISRFLPKEGARILWCRGAESFRSSVLALPNFHGRGYSGPLQTRQLATSDPGERGSGTDKREKVLTVPNLLCLSRISLSPFLAHLIVDRHFGWAAGIFAFASVTDLLDGYIARNYDGQASMLGSFLDPLADKILVATVFLSLTYVQVLPAALTSLVVSRDVLLIYAGLYIRYMAVDQPVTFRKYLDVTLPTAQIQPPLISKVNTVVQLLLVGCALVAPLLDMEDHAAFHGLCFLTAGTTFASAVTYAFMDNTYRFSRRSYDRQFGKKLTAFIFFIMFNVAFVYYFPVNSSTSGKNKSDT